jgi:hypothetical protein
MSPTTKRAELRAEIDGCLKAVNSARAKGPGEFAAALKSYYEAVKVADDFEAARKKKLIRTGLITMLLSAIAAGLCSKFSSP